jgi:DNA (cytosine-5)-methyltransferase 1
VADDAAADLAERGYRVGYALLNAVWYGVPQFRERLFFLGLRDDLGKQPEVPPATHTVSLPAGYLRPRVQMTPPLPFIKHSELYVNFDMTKLSATTVAEALDDLPILTAHLEGELAPSTRDDFRQPLPYRSNPHSPYAWLMRNWPGLPSPEVVVDHVIRRTPRDYETFRRMTAGDRYPAALRIARERMQDELKRLGERAPAPGTAEYKDLERRFIPPYPENMFLDKWRKLLPDQPSWTVPAHLSKDAYSHIHHDSRQARAISIREAARLQSFPDAFCFHGNMGECFRQVGNAVPPLLAWAIAAAVVRQLGYPSRFVPWSVVAAGASVARTDQ